MPLILPCMASHLPPPLNAGGGASATARTTAIIVALTLMGLVSRQALAGTAWAGSSAGCRRKNWTRHGCLGSAPAARLDRFPVMAWKIGFDDRTQATPSGRGLRLVPLPRTLGTEDLHGRRRSRRRTSGPSGRRPPRRW